MKAWRTKGLLIALVLLSALVPLILTGCGNGAAQSASSPKPRSVSATYQVPASHVPPQLQYGWTLANVRDEGFAIGLPPGWTKLDLSAGDLDSVLASLSQSNPNLASALSGQVASMISQGIKLYAVDMSSVAGTGFATNLNVLKEPAGDGDLSTLVKQATDEIKTQFNIDRQITLFKNSVDINSGEAERIMYDLDLNMPNGKPMNVAFVQYIAIDGANAYVLTYTTTDAQSSDYLSVFDKSATTLTFLEN